MIDMTAEFPRTISCADDILKACWCTTIEQLQKTIFKATECGAWVDVTAEGVQVGSIVEGDDAEVTADLLRFPFGENDFWRTLKEVDELACGIWNDMMRDAAREDDWS